MLNYAALEALDVVVKERSFSKAAEALLVTQSAISQRIRELERLFECPLLVRSPIIRPTAAGEELLAHFKRVAILEDQIQQKFLSGSALNKPVSISVGLNTETLSTWFIDAVDQPLLENNILLEMLIDDQERTIEYLRSGKVWGCITSVKKAPYGCSSFYLGDMFYKCVASPTFANRYFPESVNVKALVNAPIAIYGKHDYMHRGYLKKHFKGYNSGNALIHYVPSPEALVEFAVRGFAYVLLPTYTVESMFKEGKLVDLFPGKPYRLPIYWQVQELQTEATSKFSKKIIEKGKLALNDF